jgi:hypothetical protein
MLREPALFVPVLDLEMLLVRFGEPGEIQVAAVLGLGVKIYDTQNVHECGMVGGLLHDDIRAR